MAYVLRATGHGLWVRVTCYGLDGYMGRLEPRLEIAALSINTNPACESQKQSA